MIDSEALHFHYQEFKLDLSQHQRRSSDTQHQIKTRYTIASNVNSSTFLKPKKYKIDFSFRKNMFNMHTIPAYMINYIFAVMAGASIVFNLLAMFAAHNFQKNEVNCD